MKDAPQMMLTLAQLPSWAIGLMVVGFFLLCLIMILTVLIQKPQGGGLSGAFGSGAGSGQTAFGARTGDALTVATISIFVIYILAAIGLNFAVRPSIAAPPDPQAQGTSQPLPGEPASTSTTTLPVPPVPSTEPAPTTSPFAPPSTSPDAPAAPETPAAEPAPEPGADEPGAEPGADEPDPG